MAVGAETLVMKVSTDGITKASRETDALGKSAEATEKKVIKLVDSVNKMVSQFASSVSGTKALTDALSVVNRSTQASDAAMKALTGSISKLSAEVASLSARMQSGAGTVTTSTVNIRHHTEAMSEAHAAARGLSGSLGALWLTYGNIAPLAAGAAIGASMKAILNVGSDVENTLENVRIKGEATVAEMEEIRKATYAIGEGIYGPQEVAKAFETLALAGLKAKDAVNAIGAALNLATAGGSTIENAAEALVTIGTAVGASSKEYDYLADGITKAANVSLASVDSIAAAVKRASVVNKLYGASFEDILVQTAALAQLGIKNTAAGTAITNFYANSLGQTEKAKKALNELGMSFTDATGKAKPLVEAYEEFTAKLNKFDLKSQQTLISDIFGERALRDVEGLRDQVNSLADDTGKYGNKLRETQGQIAEASGTAALAAAQLALTTQKQMESVGNTLKSTFAKVFEDLGPSVVGISNKLKEVFASTEFQTMLSNLAKGFIWLAEAITNNISVLAAVAEGFLAVGAITAGGALFSRLIPIVNGLAVALGAVAVAANGAAVATGLLGQAIKFLPGIGMVLGALTTAWALYSASTEKATQKTQDLANTYTGDFLKNLEEEATRLEKVNAALAKGTTLAEANTKATRDLALEKARSVNMEAEAAAQKDLDAAQRAYTAANITNYTFDKQRSKEAQALTAAVVASNNAKAASIKFDQQAVALADRIVKASQQQAAQLKANEEARDAQAASKAGTMTYGGGDDKAAKKALSFLQEEQLELKKVAAQYEARTKAAWDSYAAGEKIAADSRQAAVMVNKEEGKYLSQKVYLQELSLAKAADEAKANYDRAVQYTEIGQKISNVIEGEKKRAELAAKGEDSGKLTSQIAAMAKFTSISKEQLEIDLKRAQVADEILKKNDDRNKIESATKSSTQRAEQYADELEQLQKYGLVAKQTAVDFAKAELAKRGFYEGDKEYADRIGAAAIEDMNKALLSLGKTYLTLQKEMSEQEGLSLDGLIGSEQVKVAVLENTAKKAIEFEYAKAAAAIDAQRSVGKITAAEAAGQLAMLSAQMDAIRSKMGEKFSIDFKVAGLKDVADIFDNMADAADRLGSKFEGPVKALDAFSKGFKSLAKIEEQEQKTGKKYSAERVGAYADMLDGAKSFFHEGTVGYKLLEKAAQAASLVQLAMNVQTMASNAATTVSGVIAGAAQMFAQSGWGGFAGVAAMGAVMAGLGFAIAGSSGGSGGMSAEEMQKNQGTGSVFGDSSAKSESISKSLEYLKDNSSVMLPLTSQMAKSLQNIENSIAGVANLVLQSGGITDGTNMNLDLGKSLNGSKWLTGNFVGDKLVNALFGSTSKTLVDSGISFGGSVDSLQNGQGYSQYASVDKTKKSLFGLIKKTTNSTETKALDQTLADQFGLIFTNLEDALKSAAGGLGKTGTEVGDAISNMVIDQTTLSLKDLKGDELKEAISAVISKTMDQIAQGAFPGLDAFRQVGEGYAETILRVSSGVEQADVALEAFNIKSIKYTDIINKQGDVAAEIFTQSVLAVEGLSGVGKILNSLTGDVSELASTYKQLIEARDQLFNAGLNGAGLDVNTIKGAGGLSELQSAIEDYQKNFFTEAEQNAMAFNVLTKQFSALNMVLPTSKDVLKGLIEQADKAGDQKLLGSLLNLSGAFAEASDKAEELAKAIKDQADATEKAARDALKTSQQEALAVAKTGVSSALDVLKKSVNAQIDLVKKKAEVDKAAAQVELNAAQDVLKSITSVFDSLKSALASTEVESDALNAARRKSAQEYLKSLVGTDLTKATGLDGALNTLSKDPKDMFSSFEDYAFDQAVSSSLITGLMNQAEVQKSFAELTVERLNDTITAIEDAANMEVERLQGIIDKAQEQVDALNGIQSAVLTIPQAITALAAAMGNYSAVQAGNNSAVSYDPTTGIASTPNAGKAGIEAIYNSVLGRASDSAGMAYWLDIYNKGASLENISKAIAGDYEYQGKLKGFAVGINEVPEDMPAMIHKGERIMPAADNAELMRRLDDTSGESKDAKIARLESAINNLTEVVRAGDMAMVGHLRDINKRDAKWDVEGLPETRQEEA